MSNTFNTLLAVVAVAGLSACTCNRVSEEAPMAAAPTGPGSSVYTPPCRPREDGPYAKPDCNPWDTLVNNPPKLSSPLHGLGIPGLDCGPRVVAPSAPAPRAAPKRGSSVYTPPCRPREDGPYVKPDCNPWDTLKDAIDNVRCPFRGVGLPGLDCAAPQPAPAPQAAAPEEHACGPFPPEAKQGEVWCCEFIQPPALPPISMKVEDEREEIQKVDCGEGDCWAKVKIPARYELVPQAATPGHWEWVRHPECEKP